MTTIKINTSSDESDCETCGSSWAEGAEVSIDGKPYGSFEPLASCFGGSYYSTEDIYRDILINHFGCTIVVDGIVQVASREGE